MMVVEERTVREGYKMTELGEIPTEWEVNILGELAIIKARIGWKGLKATEYTEEGPYLIAGKHIKGSEIIWHECDHLSNERFEESPEIQLKNADVIISKDGTIGRVAYIENLPGKATINGTMMLIRPLEKLHGKYVYFYLQGHYFQQLIKEKVSGSSIPHLFQRDMNGLKMTIPTIPEQQKIAEILTTVDEQIENTEQLLEKSKELKKGLMQKLLNKGIGHTEFKMTELGEIPVGWDLKRLDEISNFRNGKAHEQCIDDQGKYIVVNSKFISSNGNIHKNSNLNLSPLHVDEIAMVMSDVPRGKALAKCFLVDKSDTYTLNQRICSIKVNKDMDPTFLYYYLNRNKYFLKLDDGVGQTNLRKAEILECPILVPQLSEQRKIAEILLSVGEQIEEYELEKEKYTVLKKGLMQQLLTGNLRVTV
jgi:type I restriction enzyme S subunit